MSDRLSPQVAPRLTPIIAKAPERPEAAEHDQDTTDYYLSPQVAPRLKRTGGPPWERACRRAQSVARVASAAAYAYLESC